MDYYWPPTPLMLQPISYVGCALFAAIINHALHALQKIHGMSEYLVVPAVALARSIYKIL